MPVRLKGDYLRDLLNRNGKSQNWLAHKLDTPSGYFSQVINGKRNFSAKMRNKILSYFYGCKFDDLFETIPRKINKPKLSS